MQRLTHRVGRLVLFDQLSFEKLGVRRDHRVPAPEDLARAQCQPVEICQYPNHRMQSLLDVSRVEDSLDQRCAQQFRIGEHHVLFVGEVTEERSGGDAGPLRDLHGAGVLEALLVEQLQPGLLQPLFAAVFPARHAPMLPR